MTFNSVEFLLIFPVVSAVYFLLPKKITWIWLLAVSYAFYMQWRPALIILILFTTTVSFCGGLIIEKSDSAKAKKAVLTAVITICLAVLFSFKYLNFFLESLNSVFSLLGGGRPFAAPELILPAGISFYTFQTLSYAIDVYRGTIKAERHFGYYALYVSFFPQLVAGPIERPENLLPQLRASRKPDLGDIAEGLKTALTGYFKKVVVADTLAVYADKLFDHPETGNGVSVILACLAFTVQIYCDFSGYTDIAVGCARIMGIRLMQNFSLPYSAHSVKEFWARWHISLSSWLKDYIYIPLGGNRRGKARHLINLMAVFLISGLWHGASWHFVIWGGLHGIYQIVGILTIKQRNALLCKLHIDKEGKFCKAAARLTTFVLVSFAWLVFRAGSTSDMVLLVSKLFTGWTADGIREGISVFGLDAASLLHCLASVLVMALLDRFDGPHFEKTASASLNIYRLIPYLAAVWIIAFSWITALSSGGSGAFIYFQF